MPIHELADLTWEEVRDLDRSRTVAVLPVGAVEAHGPHLPLGTDVIIAQAMARSGAERIAARAWGVVLLPPLAFTSAPFGAGFAGTISIAAETVTASILDVARALSLQGFAALAIANAHLDPAHIGSLAAAAAAASDALLIPIVWPDVTRKPWAGRLTDEFKSGACHAGRYEASIVLAVRPELVRDAIRKDLPANPNSLSTAIREGKRSFEEAGGDRAYFGWPADASAEEGRATVEVLGDILAEAVVAALASGKPA